MLSDIHETLQSVPKQTEPCDLSMTPAGSRSKLDNVGGLQNIDQRKLLCIVDIGRATLSAELLATRTPVKPQSQLLCAGGDCSAASRFVGAGSADQTVPGFAQFVLIAAPGKL